MSVAARRTTPLPRQSAGAPLPLPTMLSKILGGAGRTLIFAGVILLLFVGYQLWGTGLTESSNQDDLTRSLAKTLGVGGTTKKVDDADPSTIATDITTKLAAIDPHTAPATDAPKEGDAGGFIEIARIGLRQKTFVEGVTKSDLRKGPGHYPETPLPGQAGNAAIAGHRTTYGAPFNRIDELLPGDPIVVYTPQGKFVYEVMAPPSDKGIERGKGWFTVKPNDSSVLAPTGDNRLTLTACHPKYSAAQRIIVQAKLVAEPAATTPTTTAAPGTPRAAETETPPPSGKDALIAGDHSALTPAILFGAGALAVWLLGWLGAVFFRRKQKRGLYGYLLITPGFVGRCRSRSCSDSASPSPQRGARSRPRRRPRPSLG